MEEINREQKFATVDVVWVLYQTRWHYKGEVAYLSKDLLRVFSSEEAARSWSINPDGDDISIEAEAVYPLVVRAWGEDRPYGHANKD